MTIGVDRPKLILNRVATICLGFNQRFDTRRLHSMLRLGNRVGVLDLDAEMLRPAVTYPLLGLVERKVQRRIDNLKFGITGSHLGRFATKQRPVKREGAVDISDRNGDMDPGWRGKVDGRFRHVRVPLYAQDVRFSQTDATIFAHVLTRVANCPIFDASCPGRKSLLAASCGGLATGQSPGEPRMSQFTSNDLLIRPRLGEGETTATDMLIIARSTMLGGDFSIMQGTIGPRKLLAPHTHEHEDQAVFVISGELEFEVGGEGGLRFTAGPGDYVLKPRGIEHCFWNMSESETVHYIELSGRDGFEKFIDGRKKGLVRWQAEAHLKLDIDTNFLRIPKLLKRHKLTGLAAATYGGAEQ